MYWPSVEEAMSCEAFTVTLINKDRLCLSIEEQISIHDFIMEATQVSQCKCVCKCIFVCGQYEQSNVLINSREASCIKF